MAEVPCFFKLDFFWLNDLTNVHVVVNHKMGVVINVLNDKYWRKLSINLASVSSDQGSMLNDCKSQFFT